MSVKVHAGTAWKIHEIHNNRHTATQTSTMWCEMQIITDYSPIFEPMFRECKFMDFASVVQQIS